MKSTLFACAIVLVFAACSESAPIESVEFLVANPERLRELRAQCKANHSKVGDAQCNAVAEATRRRFMGGGMPYTVPAQPPASVASADPGASAAKDGSP